MSILILRVIVDCNDRMIGRVAITDMALPLNTFPGVAYFLNLGLCLVKLPVSLLHPDLVCSLMK